MSPIENKKDFKGVNKNFMAEFTRKYKKLFVKEHEALPDLAHAVARNCLPSYY